MAAPRVFNFAVLTFNGIAANDLDIARHTIKLEGQPPEAVLYFYDTKKRKEVKSELIQWTRRYTLTDLYKEGSLYNLTYEKEGNDNTTLVYIKTTINNSELVRRIKQATGFQNRLLLKNYITEIVWHDNPEKVTYQQITKRLLKPVKYQIVPKEDRVFPQLMSFQEQNVSWMVSLEKNLSKRDLYYHDQGYCPISSTEGKVYYDSKRGLFLTEKPNPHTIRFYGGALVDEMGCGKTACAVTLCLARTPKSINLDLFRQAKKLPIKDGKIYSRATLIMVPNHISKQWVGEIDKFNYKKEKFTPKIITISDVRDHRKRTYAEIINADFVIVTYQYLFNKAVTRQLNEMLDYSHGVNGHHYLSNKQDEQEEAFKLYLNETHGRPELLDSTHVNLMYFRWNRIILDECQEWMSGHNYHRRWFLSKFFDSRYRWCLSGTPFENVANLRHIIGFLTKTSDISRVVVDHNDIVSHLLRERVFRRNTIDSTKAETPLKNIKIVEKTVWIKFTKQERLIYESKISGRARALFLRQFCCSPFTPHELATCKTFDDIINEMHKAIEKVLNERRPQLQFFQYEYNTHTTQYANAMNAGLPQNILGELNHRLKYYERKMNEVQQEINTAESSLKYYETLNALMNKDDGIECPICYGVIGEDSEDADVMSMTKCGHIFCTECIQETLNSGNNRLCPTCRSPLGSRDVFVVNNNANEEEEEHSELYKSVGSKIARLIGYIKETLEDKENYIILFAEWEEVMNRIRNVLQQQGIKTAVCKGNKLMREAAIRRFNNTDDYRVIMLSSSYASHGTNLTKANKIVILNPVGGTKEHREDIEAQAIARSYRLGQTRDLEVMRFVIKDSVEEEIYKESINEEDNNIIVVN